MSLVPVALALDRVPCLVVGAGRVAERKIAALLGAGARVRVVAPTATPRIRAWARGGRLGWTRGIYRRSRLGNARIVLACASDAAVNRTAASDARRSGALVTVVDDPSACTLIWPAVLRRGTLVVAVSTEGGNPAAARAVRDRLRDVLGPEYAAWVGLVTEARRRVHAVCRDPRERRRRTARLLRAPLMRLLRAGRQTEARRAAFEAAGLS